MNFIAYLNYVIKQTPKKLFECPQHVERVDGGVPPGDDETGEDAGIPHGGRPTAEADDDGEQQQQPAGDRHRELVVRKDQLAKTIERFPIH